MRIFKKFLFPAAFLTASALEIPTVQACGPFLQSSYINPKDGYFYSVRMDRDEMLRYFIETSDDLFKNSPVFHYGITSSEGEKHDFIAAVKKHFPKMAEAEQKKLLDTYLAFREDYSVRKKTVKKDYPALPAELDEFRLYLAGWEELDTKIKDPESWKKLLSLPADKRHFRTTWVLYVYGNIDKANVHAHAARCREAVKAGFSDTLGLGFASYRQEVRYGGNPVKVIRAIIDGQRCLYAMDAKKAARLQDMVSYLKIYNRKFSLPGEIFDNLSDSEFFQLLGDPVCREFLLIYEKRIERVLKHAEEYKFRSMDIFAYRAWLIGDLKMARLFLSKIQKPTLLSLYVESEIARYSGNFDLAVTKLEQWIEMSKKSTPENNLAILRRIPTDKGCGLEGWQHEVYGKLGYYMVMQRDFLKAAQYFYESGEGERDLPYVAERFMTLEQLVTFADSIAKDAEKPGKEPYTKPVMARMIKHLTARRAFREGKFDLAKKYMPEEFKGHLEQYLNYLAVGNNEKLSKDERAIALYNAAKILRYKGMELCGTETAPDNYRYHGNFGYYKIRQSRNCSNCKYDKHLGTWTFCKEHSDINDAWNPGFLAPKNYMTVPEYQRFHYRYLAAELALKAGELAQDQELRALIHLFGGECLRRTSYREAEIFYKRLVLRSRNTKLGKDADSERWFPYDVVPLRKEIHRIDPLPSLDAVKQLMKEAYPEKKK